MKELGELERNAVRGLESFELNLRRKLDELVWMEYFLKYEIDQMESREFIHRFFLH
jgi:hypothetical protein